MSVSDKRYEYQNNYNKRNYKRVTVMIPLYEEDVVRKLEETESMSSYILQLIKKDVKKSKQR